MYIFANNDDKDLDDVEPCSSSFSDDIVLIEDVGVTISGIDCLLLVDGGVLTLVVLVHTSR